MHGLLCTSQELINLEAMRTLRLYHTQFQTLHAAPVSASTRGCTPEQQGGSTPELQRIEALLTRVEQTVGHASRLAPLVPLRHPSLHFHRAGLRLSRREEHGDHRPL